MSGVFRAKDRVYDIETGQFGKILYIRSLVKIKLDSGVVIGRKIENIEKR